MKKLALALGLVAAALIVAVSIFLATFNADRYRPLLVQKAQEAIGRPVRLEKLSLGWRGGIALQLKGLAVYKDAAQSEPVIHIETASAVLRLLPLLRKHVKIASIVLTRPQVHASRDAQGQIDLLGLAALGGPAAVAQRRPAAVLLEIGSVRVQDGTIRWTDAATAPPMEVVVRDVDLTMRDLRPGKPITFQLRLALFSDTQNVSLKGRLRPPTDAVPAVVEGFQLEVSLQAMRTEWMSVPALHGLGLAGPLGGTLSARIDRLVLDPRAAGDLEAQVRLTDGAIGFKALRAPVQALNLEAAVKLGRLDVTRCTGRIAGGTFQLSAEVNASAAQPQVAFRASVDAIQLKDLLPAETSQGPSFRGSVSGSFEGGATGPAWPSIPQALAGRGDVTIRDGAIAKLNLLRQVFERLTVIPGLSQRLQARLPEGYQEKLDAPDTLFGPIHLPVMVQQGVLTFSDAQIPAEMFTLEGSGRIGMTGALAVEAVLRVEPALSKAIIGSVNELQYLADREGRLELPVVVQGTVSQLSVLPDLQYVASRLVVSKAQEWLGDVIQRQLQRTGEEAAP